MSTGLIVVSMQFGYDTAGMLGHFIAGKHIAIYADDTVSAAIKYTDMRACHTRQPSPHFVVVAWPSRSS